MDSLVTFTMFSYRYTLILLYVLSYNQHVRDLFNLRIADLFANLFVPVVNEPA